MQKIVAIGNNCRFYRLIRNTGPQKRDAIKNNRESDGPLIHFREHRLKQWAKHFREQISWLIIVVELSLVPGTEPMQVNTIPLSELQTIKAIGFLEIRAGIK